MLSTYNANRTQVPWAGNAAVDTKPNFVTRYAVSRQEREFDPVLQKFRDQRRELSHSGKESLTQTRSLNEAKAKQLRQQQTFDIINHRKCVVVRS